MTKIFFLDKPHYALSSSCFSQNKLSHEHPLLLTDKFLQDQFHPTANVIGKFDAGWEIHTQSWSSHGAGPGLPWSTSLTFGVLSYHWFPSLSSGAPWMLAGQRPCRHQLYDLSARNLTMVGAWRVLINIQPHGHAIAKLSPSLLLNLTAMPCISAPGHHD